MSSDSQPESMNPKRPGEDETQQDHSEDPGKTWVPEERDGHFLFEAEEVPPPPPETEAGSLGALSDSEEQPAALDKPETAGEPPRQFGEYELLERVGGGGMGNVYKAHHRHLDRTVALKTLRAGTAKNERQLERFVREAKAAARLDHPHIVPCYEFGEVSGWHYLTMAFVAGESLHERLARGPLEAEAAARLVLALAKAVAYAHHQGVIHRDIKPGNVILGDDGRPRLTDFGIAKLMNPVTTPLPPTQLTMVGQALGTPGYMSPEQSAGRRWEVGPSADIYGLGGVLVAALTGHHPGSHDSFETLAQSIPDNLQTICDRCLAYRPQDRFASADQLVSALELYLSGEKPSPAAEPATQENASRKDSDVVITIPKSHLSKMLGFVAAVLLCSLLLGNWLSNWQKRPTVMDPEPNPAAPGPHPIGQQFVTPSVPGASIRCQLDVSVNNGLEMPWALTAPNSLPLHPDDQLLVNVKVDRAENAFLFLVRVDTLGKAHLENAGLPIPLALPDLSQPGPSTAPAFAVKAVGHDPLKVDRQGPAGMMTLLLLARAKPLSDEQLTEIRSALESLPNQAQPAPSESTIQQFSFRNGQPAQRAETRDPLTDNHPVKLRLKELVKRLGPHFDQIEAISFAVPSTVQ